MATTFTSPQNSRYTRPLKATHPFKQDDIPTTITSFTSTTSPDLHSSSTSTVATHSVTVFAPTLIEKRSNSLSSLNDCDIVPFQHQLLTGHKRSNSLSNNTHQVSIDTNTPTEVHPQDSITYSRISIEGLNQEVSLALEGKPLSFQFSHPDGHIAPVNEFTKGGMTRITVTTPINAYSSPPITPTSPQLFDDLSSNISTLHLQRGSPSIRELQSPCLFPSSPKSSFVHKPRPPDNAERCTSVHTEMFYHGDVPSEGPDRSKANITFNSSAAFTPFLPPNMESLAIH